MPRVSMSRPPLIPIIGRGLQPSAAGCYLSSCGVMDEKFIYDSPSHSLSLSLTHSLTHSCTRPLTHSLTYSCTHPLTYPLRHLLANLFACSLTRSPKGPLIHSLTHLLEQILYIQPPPTCPTQPRTDPPTKHSTPFSVGALTLTIRSIRRPQRRCVEGWQLVSSLFCVWVAAMSALHAACAHRHF